MGYGSLYDPVRRIAPVTETKGEQLDLVAIRQVRDNIHRFPTDYRLVASVTGREGRLRNNWKEFAQNPQFALAVLPPEE
eukprot:11346581-Alexandrium_andersonii.AAC.1